MPLQFPEEFTVELDGLPVGDYGLRGFSDWKNPRFIVERKSMSDLAGSFSSGRKRFFAEVEKMRAFTYAAILIEGTEEQVRAGEYRSKLNPKSLLASIDAMSVRCGIHIVYCVDHEGAARRFIELSRQFIRGVEKDAERLKVGAI